MNMKKFIIGIICTFIAICMIIYSAVVSNMAFGILSMCIAIYSAGISINEQNNIQ